MQRVEGGLIVESIRENAGAGGVWENSERTFLTLEEGRLVRGEKEYWVPGYGWWPIELFTLVEQPTAVVEVVRSFANNFDWMPVYRRTYPGTTIPDLLVRFKKFAADVDDYGEILYTPRLPDATQEKYSPHGQWLNEFRQTTSVFYSQWSGLPFETVLRQEWAGSAWVDSRRTEISYTEAIGLSHIPFWVDIYAYDGVQWNGSIWESYLASFPSGQITVAQRFKYDGSGSSIPIQRIEMSWATRASVDVEEPVTPLTFVLEQNVPNPFNPSTRITYSLSEAQSVQLSVYDLLGRQIEVLDSGVRPVGEHAVSWDASAMPSGLYLYRLETAGGIATKTMVLLK